MAIHQQGVDARLLCHFDQVWSLHFEHTRHTLWKDEKDKGKLKDPNSKKILEKKMLDMIAAAVSNDVPHAAAKAQEKYEVKPACLNAQSTLIPVDQARLAKTITTLSWADGTMGRGYVAAPSTTITDTVAQEMNERLKGILYIARGHESRTHMWNGDTLQQYLAFLKEEFRRKRLALGIPFASKGMVLCDAATVHSTILYDKIRARFELEANVIMIHGGTSSLSNHGVRIVGGWGACGAPNDAFHNWYHYLRRGFMRMAVMMGANTKFRNAYESMGLSIDGNPRYT